MIAEHLDAGIVWIVFDRPDRLNAFTGETYRAVRHAIERAHADPEARVIVFTGAGRAFSAGADRSLLDGSAGDDERHLAGQEFTALIEALSGCDKPILAAVNGLAVGIGCTILLHCDLVLVAESARLRLPFTSLGVVPEAASTVLLPARCRWPDAMWAVLSSDWIDARTAVSMGLAWRMDPDAELIDQTRRAATAIAERDPASVAASKRLLTEGRLDLVRSAVEREGKEMLHLLRPQRDPSEGIPDD